MLLWSSVYSAVSEITFLPCPQLIIFVITDYSLPKFLPAVSHNLRAFEWFFLVPGSLHLSSPSSPSSPSPGQGVIFCAWVLLSCKLLISQLIPGLWFLTSIEEMTVFSLIWERTAFLYLTFLPKGTGLVLLYCLPLSEPSLLPPFESVSLFQSNCLLQSRM